MVKIDLTHPDDGLDSNWWYRINENFGFKSIYPSETTELTNKDILIHKAMIETQKFPVTHYYMLIDDDFLFLTRQDIITYMFENLLNYIEKYQKLPFLTEVSRVFNDGSINLKYQPTDYDQFVFKITDKEWAVDESNTLEQYFNSIPKEIKNDLGEESEYTIKEVKKERYLSQTAIEGQDTVYVFDAKVTGIDRRSSEYEGHVTIFYIIRIENFDASPDLTSFKRKVEFANIRIGEVTMDKYKIKIGNLLSFKGKYKSGRKGIIIQNIRKFDIK